MPQPVERADGSRAFERVPYSTPIGYRPVLLDVYVPAAADGPAPLVIWVHGGGWQEGDRRGFPETLDGIDLPGELLAAGFAVALVDYRLSHESPFPAQLHDVKAAIRYLRSHADRLGVDAQRFGLWGESAGGHLVALAALIGDSSDPALEGREGLGDASSAVAAVVDWYGIAEVATMPDLGIVDFLTHLGAPTDHITAEQRMPALEALLGGPAAERQELAAAASPLTYVRADAPPMLLMHGTDDRVVPFEQSVKLNNALAAVGASVTLVPVDGADHIFDGAPNVAELVADSVAFFSTHLS